MTFNLNYFLAAVALLWLPLPYLARQGYTSSNRARVTSATLGGALGAWQNWADLIRAGVGVYALMELSIGLEPNSGEGPLAQWIKLGIMLVGVLLQTVRTGQGILAPLFYLTGMTLVLSPLAVAGFSVVLAWVLAAGIKDPRLVLPLMGSCLLIGSYFLGEFSLIVKFNAGLIFLPLVFSLLFQKRQMFVTRESRVSSYQQRRYRVLKEGRPTEQRLKQGLKSRPSTAE